MPKFLVRVSADFSGEIGYEIDADSEEQAIELAKSGEFEATYEEVECDKCHWEDAQADVRDE